MNKQNEKYKTMLKRKNKEKKIYKDKNASLQLEKQRLCIALRNRDQEIENQHKIIEKLNLYVEFYDELSKSQNKEIERLNNIIEEVREYILTHKLYCFKYDEEEHKTTFE